LRPYEDNDNKYGAHAFFLSYNFAFEYAFRRVQDKQEGLKLNGTRQLLAYADDFSMMGEKTQIPYWKS
jgi:hypothetical protein